MNDHLQLKASSLMERFSGDTGLITPRGQPPERYLWTDAFALCNFLALERLTGNPAYLRQAANLVAQVHGILGRHREDDPRTGWISGLTEAEGERRPTAGGLRIGKPLPERRPGEPVDRQLEWDRDGQYFHYLTKWMHALDRASYATGEDRYHAWAVELGCRACEAFVRTDPDNHRRRMFWKMSIDLTYPLVNSMGHHDPLDGFIVCLQLLANPTRRREKEPELRQALAVMADLCRGQEWATPDPLGIGELLSGAYRLAQLIDLAGTDPMPLMADLLEAARRSLDRYAAELGLERAAAHRLAFRELGLVIGLAAVQRLKTLMAENAGRFAASPTLKATLDGLQHHHHLVESILDFWLATEHREVPSWTGHRHINTVMLATAMVPDGYLNLGQ